MITAETLMTVGGVSAFILTLGWVRERQLREKYAEQGFEVVGVSLDRNGGELERFLKRRPLPWPIVANLLGTPDDTPEKNAERFRVEAIPMVVLFDAEGKVDSLGLKGEELDARIRQLLTK